MLNKTPLLHQSFDPRVLLSLSLSLSLFQADPLECRGSLSSLSCPGENARSWEALGEARP